MRSMCWIVTGMHVAYISAYHILYAVKWQCTFHSNLGYSNKPLSYCKQNKNSITINSDIIYDGQTCTCTEQPIN